MSIRMGGIMIAENVTAENRIRLVYAANVRMPTEKAHGVQIMKMCEAFSANNCDVTLLATNRKTSIQEDPYKFYGVKNSFTLKRLFTLDTVRFGRVGFYIQWLSFVTSAVWYVSTHRYDAVYSRDPLVLALSKLFGRRVFWEVHTKTDRCFFKFLARRMDGIVAISKGLQEQLQRDVLGSKSVPILVAHDGVDLNQFNASISKIELRQSFDLPTDKKIVAYVGKYLTMGEEKGVREIIESFGELNRKYQNIHLLLVGIDEGEVAMVESICQASDIAEEFYTIMTHVPHADALRCMQSSDILVMNYPNKEHYAQYMSPLKLFEYMGSGNPIVSSRLPVVEEVLSDANAYLFDVDDSRAMQVVIESILNDERVGVDRAQSARKDVEAYSWIHRAARILAFIRKSD